MRRYRLRRAGGWGKVAKEGKLTIKSIKNIKGAGKIKSGDDLIVKPNQVKKVSDHGSSNGGFTISDVDVSRFNKPKK
ncbi:hypothetical protein [Alistipes sp. ZOR0009]|uniref:hypothetical protein n=1 Tax=Alistipes sp. ZOR0009 TaxID=1339253 RepID=UPI000646D9DD|nr:hypothetical protein [Alistipes sp. ZOR0009]